VSPALDSLTKNANDYVPNVPSATNNYITTAFIITSKSYTRTFPPSQTSPNPTNNQAHNCIPPAIIKSHRPLTQHSHHQPTLMSPTTQNTYATNPHLLRLPAHLHHHTTHPHRQTYRHPQYSTWNKIPPLHQRTRLPYPSIPLMQHLHTSHLHTFHTLTRTPMTPPPFTPPPDFLQSSSTLSLDLSRISFPWRLDDYPFPLTKMLHPLPLFLPPPHHGR